MAKSNRRGFLGLLTFAGFEAAVMKEVRVASPTALAATPTQVYLVMSAVTNNSDEGWYFDEGQHVRGVWLTEEAAEREASESNRAMIRDGDYAGAASYLYDNSFQDVPPEFVAALRAQWVKLVGGDEDDAPDADDTALLKQFRELLSEDSVLDFSDVSDEFIDMLVEHAGLKQYEVQAMRPEDLDPEITAKAK